MFRSFTILVRVTYLLAALAVLTCTLPWLMSFMRALSRLSLWTLYEAALLVVLFLLPLRALNRVVRRSELIPDSHIRERPVVASLVLVTNLLGGTLFMLAGWVALTSLPAEDIGGPFAGAAMLALMLFAISLLTGEMVLVGKVAPHTR